MYPQVLTLLNLEETPPDRNSIIDVLAIKGAAQARLHHFSEAEQDLARAEELCHASAEVACGRALRARGILAWQQGQPIVAKHFFEQTRAFAHLHGDQFLEATTLLNLGLGALLEQHFDEAIDWTDAAYQAAVVLDAGIIETKALGNLGWAYYNLGDSEKSLELSLEAEKRAIQAGDVIDQLSWITNAGYVYQQVHDFSRAKESYLKALDLARKINGREDIYNALRALALVSVQTGELDQAQKYSDEAIAIAQGDKNRTDELYPLLVKGMISAQENAVEAEGIFREVEGDKYGNASLKWRAEHELARLYEHQNRLEPADREYRVALGTFEAARSSLKRNDSKLPFSTNAAHIYDDYVHYLVTRGKINDALGWADYSRARTLTEGLGLLAQERPAGVAKQSLAGRPTLKSQDLARRVRGALFFYWLGEKQSYLWAITAQKTSLFTLPPGGEIDAAVGRYRKALAGPQDVLESANEDGRWLYRTLIAPAEALLAARPSGAKARPVCRSCGTAEAVPFPKSTSPENGPKVLLIPDGSLNNLNFETLIVSDPKPHFWIEDATVADASSLRVLAASYATEKKRARRLLLVGDSVAPSKDYPELAKATVQMASVARHFPASEQRVLSREQATPAAYLNSNPEQFSHIHFVAHGTASRLSPLDSAIVLSRGSAENDSFKLYARDIIGRPLRADLVTISACYGAGERAYSGEGLVGLSWAFLRAGAHNVIAALWEATDVSTEQLMSKFYDELDKGATPDAALRTAKLSLLRGGAFHNPFYWAPFQLYAGS